MYIVDKVNNNILLYTAGYSSLRANTIDVSNVQQQQPYEELIEQGSNSTRILLPTESAVLTTQDRVLIKLSSSGTSSEADVSPKNIKVKVGTTVVWQNLLPEKVYVQSKPDANHYEGELLNGSYFFPSDSREEKLDQIGTFIYDGSNGFGSYYVRGIITVVKEATEGMDMPIETIEDQNSNYDEGNISDSKLASAPARLNSAGVPI